MAQGICPVIPAVMNPVTYQMEVAHTVEGISLFIMFTVKDKNKNPLKFNLKFLYAELDNGLKSRRKRQDGLELFYKESV